MPSPNSPNSQSDRSKVNKILVALAVVTAAIVFVGALAVFLNQNNIRPFCTPYVGVIVDGNLTVNAGSYEYYNFTVPSGEPNSKVEGTFTVSGSNDIKVYVLDSANFADWQNGREANMYYDSGELSSGNVTAELPSSGTYFLVYDNTFSTTSKNVTTQV